MVMDNDPDNLKVQTVNYLKYYKYLDEAKNLNYLCIVVELLLNASYQHDRFLPLGVIWEFSVMV